MIKKTKTQTAKIVAVAVGMGFTSILLAACSEVDQPLPAAGAGSMDAAKKVVVEHMERTIAQRALDAARTGLTFDTPVGKLENGQAVFKVQTELKLTGERRECTYQLQRLPDDKRYGWSVINNVCRVVNQGNY